MLFATYNAAGVLVSSALKNFNKATDISPPPLPGDILKEHHKEYIAASVKAENFIKIMQKPQKAGYSKINPDREKSEAAAQYHLVHSLLR